MKLRVTAIVDFDIAPEYAVRRWKSTDPAAVATALQVEAAHLLGERIAAEDPCGGVAIIGGSLTAMPLYG